MQPETTHRNAPKLKHYVPIKKVKYQPPTETVLTTLLTIAIVMDPRFKMNLVQFHFSKIFGDEAPLNVMIVDGGLHKLFLDCVALPLPLTPTYAEDENFENMKTR